ncbi:hypothetical protein TRIUR3_09027 [Triticum urartu]|uniref:Uncharacterized protein n=1 Tax=Triticum urartu TaxID=4572 RepID=M8AU79_TRIUA|nr:hypothetical protein TRIUR3_09027 [Triticum urartu]
MSPGTTSFVVSTHRVLSKQYLASVGGAPDIKHKRNAGTPGGVKYFGELEDHCFWGNEVKLYEHHVDKLFTMFWHKKPKIDYYVCTINKTFAKPGQRMVEYTKDKLQEYIKEDNDTLPLKNADGTGYTTADTHVDWFSGLPIPDMSV